MEKAPDARAICGAARGGYRARRLQSAQQGEAQGRLRLRRLRPAAIFLRDQIRERDGLAELLETLAQRGRHPARQHSLLRSEEHTSELQSLMRISYAVLCLKKK